MAEVPARILVVDDKPNMLRLLAKILRSTGQVQTAESGGEALDILDHGPVDVVLCDLKMPDMTGLEVMARARERGHRAVFVIMTAYATVGTAVEALRQGAYDYLSKPFEPEDIRHVVLAALGRARGGASGGVESDDEVLPGVVGRSTVMRQLADLVRRVADSDATVLVLGETGTGKERIARAIHHLSPRASQRFVALSCAAIPADLLESELFGYAKGAFTGAATARAGLFEEATGGTLFLDEVGEMLPSVQAKLTRATEERAIRRLGEFRERPVDVRLIAATHRDLEAMVEAGTFREDLWYRLNVALLRLPPLRQRPGDVELLAQHFLTEMASRRTHRQVVRTFSPRALELLKRYHWPGNVRQLRAAVERACVVARGSTIEAADLPEEIRAPRRGATADALLLDLTWSDAMDRARRSAARSYLGGLLERYGGDIHAAAQHAGVERESFYRLLRRFGISPPHQRPH